jgi:uncharacterized membrane protein
MGWLTFAFAAPVLWAISTHIDKYLVDRYFRQGSVAVLLLFTGTTGALLAPAIWLLRPASLFLPPSNAILIAGSGALSMVAMSFYLAALQTEEASTVAPWFQVAPLFGYGLGYVLLGEVLTPRQMLGGAAIVASAVLLSLRAGRRAGGRKMRLAALMMACAFMIALSTAVFKLFAIRDEFWRTTAWTSVGQAVFGAGLLLRLSTWRELRSMLGGRAGTVLTVNAANEGINLGGILAQRYALLLAPLSLVQAIGGTTPLFVFLFGVVVSLAGPTLARENLSMVSLMQKAVAAILVAVGVGLISD